MALAEEFQPIKAVIEANRQAESGGKISKAELEERNKTALIDGMSSSLSTTYYASEAAFTKPAISLGILTTAPLEFYATVRALKPLPDRKTVQIVTITGLPFAVGLFAGIPSVVVKSTQGTEGKESAVAATYDLLSSWSPKAMIAVGFAFGTSPDTTAYGDVLVGAALFPYNLHRLTEGEVTFSNPPLVPRNEILTPFLQASDSWDFSGRIGALDGPQRKTEVHTGLLLTGSILADDESFVSGMVDKVSSHMKAKYPKVPSNIIGGEMEGAGLFDSCARYAVPCILVKSICDYGGLDGAKSKEAQPFSVLSAISYTKHVLSDSKWLSKLPVPALASLELLKFDAFIANKTAGFVGRTTLFNAVDKWRKDAGDSKRVLLVTGAPGLGKSAWLSALVSKAPHKDSVIAYHFCRYDSPETLDPRRFLSNIAKRLAVSMAERSISISSFKLAPVLKTLSDPSLPVDTAFQALIDALPRKLKNAPDGALLIAVDSLDEAHDAGGAGGDQIIAALASVVGKLPDWLRIIATTRNNKEILGSLLPPLQAEAMHPADADNLADIAEYIDARLSDKELRSLISPAITKEQVKSALLKSSEGNFLYLTNMLDINSLRDMSQPSGLLTLEALEEFPVGLRGYYSKFAARLYPTPADFARAEQILAVLVAAPAAVPVRILKGIFEPNTPGFQDRNKDNAALVKRLHCPEPVKVKVVDILEDLSQVLEVIQPRLLSNGTSTEQLVRIYHKSFADWLVEDGYRPAQANQPWMVDARAHRQRIEPSDGHALLARIGASRWLMARDEAKTSWSLVNIGERRKLGGSSGGGPGDPSNPSLGYPALDFAQYLIEHLVEHLVEAQETEFAVQHVLSSHEWLHVRVNATSVNGLLEDFSTVLQDAKASSWVDDAKELQSILTQNRHLIGERSPQLESVLLHYLAESDAKRHPALHAIFEGLGWMKPKTRRPRNKRLRAVLTGHRGAVQAVAALGPGTLISGSSDGTMRVWRMATGQSELTIAGPTPPSKYDEINLTCMGLVENKTQVVAGYSNSVVRRYDVKNGLLLAEMYGHSAWVSDLSVFMNGTHFATSSYDGDVRIWNTKSNDSLFIISQSLTVAATSVCAIGESPSQVRVMVGFVNGVVQAHKPKGDKLASEDSNDWVKTVETDPKVHANLSVDTIAHIPLSSNFLTAGKSGYITSVNADNGRYKLTATGGRVEWDQVAVDEQGTKMIGLASDESVRLFNIGKPANGANPRDPETQIRGVGASATSCCFLKNGLIATGDRLYRIVIWRPDEQDETEQQKTIGRLDEVTRKRTDPGHFREMRVMLPLKDGRVITGAYDGYWQIWKKGGKEVQYGYKARAGEVRSLALSADGKHVYVAYGWAPGVVRCFEIPAPGVLPAKAATDPAIRVFPHNEEIVVTPEHAVAFRDESLHSKAVNVVLVIEGLDDYIFTADEDGRIVRWDVATRRGESLTVGSNQAGAHTKKIYALADCGDGKHLLSGSNDGLVKKWNAVSGTFLWQVYDEERESSKIAKVAVIPHTNLFLIGSRNGVVQVRRLDDGGPVASVQAHDSTVRAVIPITTRFFLTASMDATVRLWRVPANTREPLVAVWMMQIPLPVYEAKFDADNRRLLIRQNDIEDRAYYWIEYELDLTGMH